MYLVLLSLLIIQASAVEIAMQLMDRSSLGRDYNSFKALHSRLERALQYVVNGFNVFRVSANF
jgi:Sec8 exocyst complex component specific domain